MVDAVAKTFNPWNLKNKDISIQDVESIMHRYGCPGFKVRDHKWFAQACVHKSYVDAATKVRYLLVGQPSLGDGGRRSGQRTSY
jgi:hypothetical protein